METIKIFHSGDKVSVDLSGQGTVLNSIGVRNYTVEIDGSDYIASVDVDRLQLIKPQNTTTCISNAEKQTCSSLTGSENKRFIKIDENYIDKLLNKQGNPNAARKILFDTNLLHDFISTNNDHRRIHEIPPNELNDILCKFIVSARKLNGGEFENNTLRGIGSSVERYLRSHNYGHTLRESIAFSRYREVMKAKQKELKSLGKGNLPHRSDAITDEEIESLWQAKQLGSTSPQSILNTLWFYNTIHFGLRGSDEHKQMLWGDVELKLDSDGLTECLEFTERVSKTRHGYNSKNVRQITPKMWANSQNKDRCPVELFKLYKSLRPHNFSNPENSFYISCTTVPNPDVGSIWFKRQQVGIQT
ncbi:hypothetical protein SNE40_009879 [Patella caerulea]|uniref:ZMYM2-like/QRICH1 C-terminal domain-containing protein n=1 Tax=Patella caerulea TaxID=87958 RepID=A0AAN8JZV0_PATCE